LCRKIGRNYHYKENKVGCFSQLGILDLPNRIWDFDGSPHKLCCKKERKSCESAYGRDYYYHCAGKCVKFLIPGKQ
jgi:hypothetical protein